MKEQMKSSLFTAALGLALTGVMLSSSTNEESATTANQAPTLHALPVFTAATANIAAAPTSIPFTVYLSLVTSFTNGQSIDFNVANEEGQSSILDKMTNWKEEQ